MVLALRVRGMDQVSKGLAKGFKKFMKDINEKIPDKLSEENARHLRNKMRQREYVPVKSPSVTNLMRSEYLRDSIRVAELKNDTWAVYVSATNQMSNRNNKWFPFAYGIAQETGTQDKQAKRQDKPMKFQDSRTGEWVTRYKDSEKGPVKGTPRTRWISRAIRDWSNEDFARVTTKVLQEEAFNGFQKYLIGQGLEKYRFYEERD